MKRIALINFITGEVKENGVLSVDCPESLYATLNEALEGTGLIWLIEPDKKQTDENTDK